MDHWIMLSKNSAERNNLVQLERRPSFSQIVLAVLAYNLLHLSQLSRALGIVTER